MKIRYIVSMSGSEKSFPAFEKDNSGEWVFHELDDVQAVRMVELERAVPKNKSEYEKVKANIEELKAKKQAELELSENIVKLDEMKAREVELKAELKSIASKILEVNIALGNEDEEIEVLKKYKEDKSIVIDLGAEDLKLICDSLNVEYTNADEIREHLKTMEHLEPINKEILAENLVEAYKADTNIVDELKAEDLKTLCDEFKIDYTNAKEAKESLRVLDIKGK